MEINCMLNVAIFFAEYEPYHLYKDPGQIVLGLNEIGVDAVMVSFDKASLVGYRDLPIRLIDEEKARSSDFWRISGYDVVLAYTWLRSNRLWVVDVITKSGIPIIVKGDTDGRLNFPLHPMWDRYLGKYIGLLPYLKIARRRLKRWINSREISKDLIYHISTSSAAIVETPQAMSNIASLLTYSDRADLIPKLTVIPNPVVPLTTPIIVKKNIVISVGSWKTKYGDYFAKNTRVMCESIVKFLKNRRDFEFIVIGMGEQFLRELFKNTPNEIRERIHILGEVHHQKVMDFLCESKIFYMPSISEGLSIAASEALVCGCSIVGSPIESLEYLTQGGAYGTLAVNFDNKAFLSALITDSIRWDRGEYDSKQIADFWQSRLNRKALANKFLDLFISIRKNSSV